jgi:AraC-like DNA-binding protein
MHFELTGHSSYRPESTNAHSLAVDIPNGHHQLFYFPRVKGSLYYPPSPKRTTLEITISHHFLKRMFHREWEIMKQLGAAIDGNEPLIVGTTSKKISPQLHVVIQQIVNCKIEGIMKRPYLAAKVMELFILQLQELTESSFLAKPSTVSELELRALSEAKDYIHQNLNSNCTIAHIAKAVGLNTLKLKTGFKQIYGDTVFEYLTKARMQEAVRLLMNTNLQIGEVANSVGYKHSQHFAKAFKKQFGVLPNGFDRRSSFSVKN